MPLPVPNYPWSHPHLDDGIPGSLKPYYTPSFVEIQARREEAAKAMQAQVDKMERHVQSGIMSAAMGKSWAEIVLSQEEAELLAKVTVVPPGPAKPHVNSLETAENRRNMIAMRLHVDPRKFPFPHFNSMYDGETVYISIVVRQQGVMLTDPASEFPSDTLMTQLRLLL